jgi:hypothetical protein
MGEITASVAGIDHSLPLRQMTSNQALAAFLCTLNWTAVRWLRLSRKQDRLKPEVGALPTPSANSKPLTKGNPMKPVLRYQSQLLYRRSYKPPRAIRIRPGRRLNIVFRPMRRFGSKPELINVP